MITGELKNKIDSIWTTFWTGGITNPLSVIEQITYLLFIRRLDEIDDRKQRDSSAIGVEYRSIFPSDRPYLKWRKFKSLEASKMYKIVSEEVFPFIKNLNGNKESAYSKYMNDAIFIIPTPQLLEKVVTGLSELPMDDRDITGDIYEYMLSKVATSVPTANLEHPGTLLK